MWFAGDAGIWGLLSPGWVQSSIALERFHIIKKKKTQIQIRTQTRYENKHVSLILFRGNMGIKV